MEPNFPFLEWRQIISGLRDLSQVTIVCGDRQIILRDATGEVGPDGPFPYITLKDEQGSMGFCVHADFVFDELWKHLEKIYRMKEFPSPVAKDRFPDITTHEGMTFPEDKEDLREM